MKKPTARYIIIKLFKIRDEEKILKASRKKRNIMLRGTKIKMIANFSSETMQAIKDCSNIFKVLKANDCQSRILCPAKHFSK